MNKDFYTLVTVTKSWQNSFAYLLNHGIQRQCLTKQTFTRHLNTYLAFQDIKNTVEYFLSEYFKTQLEFSVRNRVWFIHFYSHITITIENSLPAYRSSRLWSVWRHDDALSVKGKSIGPNILNSLAFYWVLVNAKLKEVGRQC